MAIETTIYSPRTLGKLITRMPPVHTFFPRYPVQEPPHFPHEER